MLDPVSNKRASHYKFGVGLQYDFTRALAMRVEAERYRINDAVGNEGDIDFVSLDRPVRTEKYCGILDFQFEINQDEIQREVKKKLGVVGAFLVKYPDTTTAIEGHTDDVGTSQQNMELSQRRAESVVAYLVQMFDVASSKPPGERHHQLSKLAAREWSG